MTSLAAPSAEVEFLASHLRHVSAVRRHLQRIRHELERRELVHDDSKLTPEELPGFVRLAAAAKDHAFGSDGYRAAIEAERSTVRRHQWENSHHPECNDHFHTDILVCNLPRDEPTHMGWVDIVEMVCDWRGAYETRKAGAPWMESVAAQLKRFKWSAGQAWLIEQVAWTLETGTFVRPTVSPLSREGGGDG